MNVLLVWPNKDTFTFKPIGLSLISALLKREGHNVELFDTTFIDFGCQGDTDLQSKIRVFKPVNFDGYDITKKNVNLEDELVKKLNKFKPDIVGISALFDEISIGIDISKIVKRWDKKVIIIWGNKQPTMSPKEILRNKEVDYVCRGEGIEFIINFIRGVQDKKDISDLNNLAYKDNYDRIVINKLNPFFQDMDSLPFLDWSIFDERHFIKPYEGKIYIGGDHMVHWGCPNSCTYCINHAYRKLYKGTNSGSYIRWYSVDRIIKELKYLMKKWNITFYKFQDEDFCLKSLPYLEEFCEKYNQEINIPFAIMANVRNLTKEKIFFLEKMNCASVSIGIENGNDHLRKEVLKRRDNKEDVIEAIHNLNNVGIRTSSFNMLGIPFENRSTIMETVELNRKSQVRYPNTSFFYPLDNTVLKEVCVSRGLFDVSKKEGFDPASPNISFTEISDEELIALRERFVLYVKMPQCYYKYIKRSEKNDEVGKKLTLELYKIYDRNVFMNDGKWSKEADDKNDLYYLDKIIREK